MYLKWALHCLSKLSLEGIIRLWFSFEIGQTPSMHQRMMYWRYDGNAYDKKKWLKRGGKKEIIFWGKWRKESGEENEREIKRKEEGKRKEFDSQSEENSICLTYSIFNQMCLENWITIRFRKMKEELSLKWW